MPEIRARGGTNTGWTQGSAQHNFSKRLQLTPVQQPTQGLTDKSVSSKMKGCISAEQKTQQICPTHSIFPFFKNKNNNNHQKIPPTRSSTEPALICKCSPCCKEKKNCLCIRAAEHFREACRQGEKTLLIGSNEQEAGTILLFLQGFESSSDSPESNLLNELLPMLQHRHLSGRVRKGHCCPTGNSSG